MTASRDLCIMACVFCREPEFHRWLGSVAAAEGLEGAAAELLFDEGVSEAAAKAFILNLCRVSSRSQLDTDLGAGRRFLTLVRDPFVEWRDAQPPAADNLDWIPQ